MKVECNGPVLVSGKSEFRKTSSGRLDNVSRLLWCSFLQLGEAVEGVCHVLLVSRLPGLCMQERDTCKEQVGELSARLARLQEEASRAEQAQQSSSTAVATAGAPLTHKPRHDCAMRIIPSPLNPNGPYPVLSLLRM